MSNINSKAHLIMKTFEKSDLDPFLELPIVARSFIKLNKEYSRIHDDNDGNSDQCIKISLKEDVNPANDFFEVRTPVSPGLRFRTHQGGGASLPIHNALQVLIYANSKNDEIIIPGLERDLPKKYRLNRQIKEILDGIIVLPPEIFDQNLNHFFKITEHFKVAIAVDGDTHIITNIMGDFEKLIKEETSIWNPEPLIFTLNSNCTRAVYNALILLTCAIKHCNQER